MNRDPTNPATTRGQSKGQPLSSRLEQQIHQLARNLASDDLRVGFSSSEWSVLTQLINASDLSLKDLASRAGTTMSTASKALQKLTDQGLTDWNRRPNSQRTYAIRITAAGRERYATARPRERQIGTRAALEQLSQEDLLTIVGILDKCLRRPASRTRRYARNEFGG